MDTKIQIQVVRSNRKTLSMRITGPGAVEIRAPKTVSQAQIDEFIRQHQAWLDKPMAIVNRREAEAAQLPPLTLGHTLLTLAAFPSLSVRWSVARGIPVSETSSE